MAKKVIMVGDATSLLLGTQRPFGGRVSGIGATAAPWAWVQGVGMYTVQSGDTLSGIAAKYLGDWSEYRYIWQAQDDAYRSLRGKPENIRAGDRLVMPDAASDKAVALNLLGPRPPPAAGDKSVVYTMPETIIYGDGTEATTAPLTVDPAMTPGVVKPVPAPWSLSDFVDNLKPWQKYAALGALFLGAAGTAIVVVKKKKKTGWRRNPGRGPKVWSRVRAEETAIGAGYRRGLGDWYDMTPAAQAKLMQETLAEYGATIGTKPRKKKTAAPKKKAAPKKRARR